MAALERLYYSIISVKVFPEALTELFCLVKYRLSKGNVAGKTTGSELKADKNLQYMVAFNPTGATKLTFFNYQQIR